MKQTLLLMAAMPSSLAGVRQVELRSANMAAAATGIDRELNSEKLVVTL